MVSREHFMKLSGEMFPAMSGGFSGVMAPTMLLCDHEHIIWSKSGGQPLARCISAVVLILL